MSIENLTVNQFNQLSNETLEQYQRFITFAIKEREDKLLKGIETWDLFLLKEVLPFYTTGIHFSLQPKLIKKIENHFYHFFKKENYEAIQLFCEHQIFSFLSKDIQEEFMKSLVISCIGNKKYFQQVKESTLYHSDLFQSAFKECKKESQLYYQLDSYKTFYELYPAPLEQYNLHCACSYGSIELLEFIYEQHTNFVDQNINSCFTSALSHSNQSGLTFFKQKYPDIILNDTFLEKHFSSIRFEDIHHEHYLNCFLRNIELGPYIAKKIADKCHNSKNIKLFNSVLDYFAQHQDFTSLHIMYQEGMNFYSLRETLLKYKNITDNFQHLSENLTQHSTSTTFKL